MGRTAQPAALKLLNGRREGVDSGGRKVKLPPKFRRRAPVKPDWLTPEASDEWDRVSPELLRLDLMKAEDRSNFAAYCECVSQLRAAVEILKVEGLFIDAKQGKLPHPAVGIFRGAQREMRGWAAKFGLTPSDESNLAIGDVGDGDDSPFN